MEYTYYSGNYYGTPRSEVTKRIDNGETVILVIETEGAANIKSMFPEAVTVFLMPPSIDILKQRLYNRHTETDEQMLSRLKIAQNELRLAVNYDYCVVNDDLDRCTEEIHSLIQRKYETREDN